MKNILITLILIILAGTSVSAQKYNKKGLDSKNQKEILVGLANREGLQTGDFEESYKTEYSEYKPDNEIIKQLQCRFNKVTVTVVMGTWCGDSKDQVPRFYKIIDQTCLKERKIKLICVDRDKKAGDLAVGNLDIKLVPTFIFYRNKKEIGRIIETPQATLEKDMLGILLK